MMFFLQNINIQGPVQRMDVFEMGNTLRLFGREWLGECSSIRVFLAFLPLTIIEPWSVEHRVFAFESFVRHNESQLYSVSFVAISISEPSCSLSKQYPSLGLINLVTGCTDQQKNARSSTNGSNPDYVERIRPALLRSLT